MLGMYMMGMEKIYYGNGVNDNVSLSGYLFDYVSFLDGVDSVL